MSNQVIKMVRRMPPLPTTKDLLRMYQIKAKKSLSQNFIMDPTILTKFARTAGNLQDAYAVEVGPGPGGITRAILEEGVKELHVIEKDPRFLPSLNMIKEVAGSDRLRINIGDCLTYNVQKMFKDKLEPTKWDSPVEPNLKLLGNLPFNVATPYIIKTLKEISTHSNVFHYGRATAVLTFQHEVACRMCAPPNDPNRSRLSVVSQNWADVQYVFQLNGGAFVPPPKVDVGVVRLIPLREPYINLPFELVNKVVTALFVGGKQKFLSNSLAYLFTGHPMLTTKHARIKWAKTMLDMTRINHKRMSISLEMEEIRELCFAYRYLLEKEPDLVLTTKPSDVEATDPRIEMVKDESDPKTNNADTDSENSDVGSGVKYSVKF